MRTFEREEQEFFHFQIEGSEEVYKIPLPLCMTNRQIVSFESCGSDYRKQVEWLRSIVGDVVDDLTIKETSAILQGWLKASKESGAEVGESSALSEQ